MVERTTVNREKNREAGVAQWRAPLRIILKGGGVQLPQPVFKLKRRANYEEKTNRRL